MLDPMKGDGKDQIAIPWLGLRRREPTSVRPAQKNQFYPIFVDKEKGHIHSIGDAITPEVDRTTIAAPEGTMDLSRFCAAPGARLSHFPFESDGAFPA